MIFISNSSDEWSTPQFIFDKYNSIYHFDIDICASRYNKKCDLFFDLNDNALSKEWHYKNIWCNPPYSKGNIEKFVKKAFESWKKYNNNIVLLIPSYTDRLYFHNYILPYCEIEFIKGRLHFNDSINCAPFPSMICIFKGVKK